MPPKTTYDKAIQAGGLKERKRKMKKTNTKQTLIEKICQTIAVSTLALLAVLLPSSLMAAPIVIAINDVPNGRPIIQVYGAPNGYNIYTGDCVNTAGIEDGALITLFGVDTSGSIPDWSGRFVIPTAPNPDRRAVDIVWVEHDSEDCCKSVCNGDLQIGFNSAFPNVYYGTPGVVNADEDLGVVTDKWVQVYTSDTVVIFFNPHTYRLRN